MAMVNPLLKRRDTESTRVLAKSAEAPPCGCDDEDEDEEDDSLSALTEYEDDLREATAMEQLANSIGTTMEKVEKALAVQGMLLLKIADQAAKGPPPANVTVDLKPTEQRPRAFTVEVIRGRDNLISELVVKPIGD